MDIGSRLKELRKEKGLTLEQVGNIIGVSKSTILKYEKGETQNMKRANIQKLAEYFGVSPTYLMGMEEMEPPAGTDGSDAKRELFSLIDSLTEEQAAEARHYLEFLKNKEN